MFSHPHKIQCVHHMFPIPNSAKILTHSALEREEEKKNSKWRKCHCAYIRLMISTKRTLPCRIARFGFWYLIKIMAEKSLLICLAGRKRETGLLHTYTIDENVEGHKSAHRKKANKITWVRRKCISKIAFSSKISDGRAFRHGSFCWSNAWNALILGFWMTPLGATKSSD